MERVAERQAARPVLCVAVGTARLPASVGGAEVLAIELAVDAATNEIVEIVSTFQLPNYAALLRRLFVGRQLGDIDKGVQELGARLRGPLLRPTQAAITKAVSNYGDSASSK